VTACRRKLGPDAHLGQAFPNGFAEAPVRLLLLLFSSWINRQQQDVIEYLLEENRVLRAARGSQRIRLTDDQRRRLAVKGKALGRRCLADVAGIVTPDTILRCGLLKFYHRTAA
jgi:hypothetical protein